MEGTLTKTKTQEIFPPLHACENRSLKEMKSSKSLDAEQFLDLLRQEIEVNLRSTSKGEVPAMSKEELFDLSGFMYQADFEKEIHGRGLKVKQIIHNASPATLYENALRKETGSFITSSGALTVTTGRKTGRSPSDKRVVNNISGHWPFADDIWWGKVNIKLSPESFLTNRERAIDYLNTMKQIYVVDAYAGWDPKYRIKIRIIASRAYHALFMENMLIMPTKEELKTFKPDFVIYNAGCFPANRLTEGMTSQTTVAIDFKNNEMVILGTEYAGEMKKGVLTLMMYLMPIKGQLPLHSSCNVGKGGDVSLFFGLSGTGKTTLSADPNRQLIGDDEHVWTDTGVFNVEGGCYAKAVGLTPETEPEIFSAIRFGCVLENVAFNPITRIVDYNDISITENTRAAYPLHFIRNAMVPAVVARHPQAIILLCCDAFGVLPPVSKLTPEQVQYYFISGYTAKVAGTEQGITEPQAAFSACFAGPFLVWHPIVYAKMLAEKLQKFSCNAYLLNTGWTGGAYGVGKRIKLAYTRRMVDAINSGALVTAQYENLPVFNLPVPKHIDGVPDDLLWPSKTWPSEETYYEKLNKLAELFNNNFAGYADKCPQEIKSAGPSL